MKDCQNDEFTKCDAANELLATADSKGMSVAGAERELADSEASEETKALADEVLATADKFGLNDESAAQCLGEGQ